MENIKKYTEVKKKLPINTQPSNNHFNSVIIYICMYIIYI